MYQWDLKKYQSYIVNINLHVSLKELCLHTSTNYSLLYGEKCTEEEIHMKQYQ